MFGVSSVSIPRSRNLNKNRPIKILRVIARLNVGGPALHCLLLSKTLSRSRFESVLVTGATEPGEASYEELFEASSEGFRHFRLPRLRRKVSLVGDFKTLWELIKIMRREKPDIVHTHTAKAGVLGRLAAHFTRVPIVVHTFHGHVLSGYFSKWIAYLVCRVEKSLAKRTSAIVTLSSNLKVELSEKFKIAPASRFHVIPLGRDLGPFFDCSRFRGQLRRELGISNPSAGLIGTVGRLVSIKDHVTLIDACDKLRAFASWHLVIVGDGDLREMLEKEVIKRGLKDRVHFLGWRNDLPLIYADFDVFALSSRNEGTPLSIIEAFAARCPVVATRVGGVPDLFHNLGRGLETKDCELVELCDEGVLVPPGNSIFLKEGLERILGDEAMRMRMGAAAQQSSKSFTEAALTSKVSQLYEDLLASRPHVYG